MSVSREILAWSATRPEWQRDAMRRFITRQAFSETDEAEVAILLKAEHGLSSGKVIPAEPLEEKHLPIEGVPDEPVQLASVGDSRNANRLATGQTLHFAINGLTAVYGDNGSGKSGYVRILKQASRTREADVVLPDVYKPGGPEKPTATLRYRLSPTSDVVAETWTSGEEFVPALSQIAVFDSRIASIVMDKENELSFVPFGLDVLVKLGELCEALKIRLTAERNTVNQRISDTRLGFGNDADLVAAIDKITAKTTDKTLNTLSIWSTTDGERLTLISLMLSDPTTQAKLLRARKERLEKMLNKVADATSALGSDTEALLTRLVADADATNAALQLLSVKTFAEEPLPGVGTEAWRVMYEAARDFSVELAYPDRDFPATNHEDRCVLCHQPLNDDARHRLERFEAFVKADVETKAQAAVTALSIAFASLDAALAQLASVEDDAVGTDPADTEWAASILEAGRVLIDRGRSLKLAAESRDWTQIPPIPELGIAAKRACLAGLEAQAVAHEAALAPSKKAELSAEMAALKARQAFSRNKAAVMELRALLIQDAAYEKCLKALATKGISQKRKEMEEAHVQGALRAKLDEEMTTLRLSSIPINLGFKVSKVKARHQIQLDGLTAAAKVKEVVSEGEYRALALACFLAQVRQQSTSGGIIVDDPVSSLDHDRRELVARRLVAEAKNRQVIVFTHDLVFFFMLRESAAELRVPFEGRSLYRGADGFGTVDPHEPWKAKTLGQRLTKLASEDHKRLVQLYAEGAEDYEAHARAFCDRLRESWERLVEEGVFNETVMRFNPGIKTLRLEGVEVPDEVASRVFWGMTKISNWTAHDPATAKCLNLPAPDEMKAHIDEIRECETIIRKVRKDTAARRDMLRQAPKAEIV